MSFLFVVATPIGNLDDMSNRALNTLKEVDLILSEDTRETSKILKKYSIEKPQISYRDQNHVKVIGHIKDYLDQGKNVAIVSDSGTPTISDPGFKLIREIRRAGIQITPIPGPSAIIAALSVSGLPTDNFAFLGFLPKKTTQRRELLVKFGSLPATLVLYESPYRVTKLLEEISECLGNRIICVAKDLTKKFEKVVTAPIVEFLLPENLPTPKGEYTVLVAKEDFIWTKPDQLLQKF